MRRLFCRPHLTTRSHKGGDDRRCCGRPERVLDRREGPRAAAREDDGLVELWQHTRLSRALLSKDRAWTPVPDAANVLRIALAFSVGLEGTLLAHATRRSLSWCRRTGGCSYPIALARARARIDSNPLTVRRPSGDSTRIGCEKARKNTRGSLIGLRLRRAGFKTSRLVTSVTPQCLEFHGRSLQTPTTGMLGTPASR